MQAGVGSNNAAMLNTDDAIRARRSVRGFRPEPVPDELMQRVFDLAQCAPSNCNTQPWVVHVASGAVRDHLRLRLLQAAADPAQHRPDFPYDGRYDGVFRARQLDAAVQLYGVMGIARDDKAGRAASYRRNFELFDAPHVAFLFIPGAFGLREAADIGMYAQTLMLALTAHGLASCPQTSLSFFPRVVREVLGVDAGHKLLFGLAFGYEDPGVAANACRVGRAALSETVAFHR